jgi:membrane protease YdiL (CAAX protease family)
VLWAALPLVVQLLVATGATLVALILFTVIGRSADDINAFLNGDLQLYLLPLATITTVVVAIGVSLLMLGRRILQRVAWRGCAPRQWCLVLLLVVPVAVVASEFTNCVDAVLCQFNIKWLDELRTTGEQAFGEFVKMPFIVVFVAGCLLPGLGEELYCRGFLSRGLIARHGVIVGTLVASVLFGAMHLEPVQAMGATLLGVALQVVFLNTCSLKAAIALHTLNNALAFVLMRSAGRVSIPGVIPLVRRFLFFFE